MCQLSQKPARQETTGTVGEVQSYLHPITGTGMSRERERSTVHHGNSLSSYSVQACVSTNYKPYQKLKF